ncbi:3-hydroxyisobutyrate dehydrogenase [Pseudoxanthobacter soli DSM 19599]|uniref:3-hydroxyisobutyrate dehydrogenase n=1 Tax=Pseudoxanthobacter soli DSM 19599 TaxID=1123029 RepID=A0A1M7ZKP1_9HYPH|nr:NAD(P)-dependent oxidoreductase [Pseudoxanthobacter soli]SHO65473.1 3-hydroxyisobutyrate dehydrogenase [Pseudoxanthobacter soli DSM 19599]
MTATRSSIAFIGIGQMGLPMVRRLLKAGFAVTGFDLSEAARAELVSAGGKAAATAAEATTGAEVIITMLPNGKIVQSVLLDDSHVLANAAPGAVVLEMSSSAPTETRALLGRLPPGLRLVDAPVSGGVKRAIEGALTIMVGGDVADLDDVEPVLSAMATRVFRCGPVGAGHAMKAINNFVSGAGVIAAVEAVELGRSFGLDPADMIDVLNASSGRNNATEIKMKQFVLSGTFASGFALGLMAKDIRTAADLSRDLGLGQDCLRQTADVWEEAAKALGASVDHTRIAEFLAVRERERV